MRERKTNAHLVYRVLKLRKIQPRTRKPTAKRKKNDAHLDKWSSTCLKLQEKKRVTTQSATDILCARLRYTLIQKKLLQSKIARKTLPPCVSKVNFSQSNQYCVRTCRFRCCASCFLSGSKHGPSRFLLPSAEVTSSTFAVFPGNLLVFSSGSSTSAVFPFAAFPKNTIIVDVF